jgi:hypothetical protein
LKASQKYHKALDFEATETSAIYDFEHSSDCISEVIAKQVFKRQTHALDLHKQHNHDWDKQEANIYSKLQESLYKQNQLRGERANMKSQMVASSKKELLMKHISQDFHLKKET